ncbi:hypothetical protein PoB_000750200 [Plakobranchus ocellatus]|uniref:DUF4817 domain-containing protein n=1 Tax=Plakobranchus ocellatus TaxID=259542 RepID=A0AAV3YEX4_9GAST|nr:hypothetical protein PoB_000750200 [Plakobranchus ocellatus]
MPWTTEQKTFAVEAYFELKSTAAVQLRFRRRFQCRDVPCHRSIYLWITQKIRQIPREECVRVIGNFARRLQVCLQRGGGHMEHILERQ